MRRIRDYLVFGSVSYFGRTACPGRLFREREILPDQLISCLRLPNRKSHKRCENHGFLSNISGDTKVHPGAKRRENQLCPTIQGGPLGSL